MALIQGTPNRLGYYNLRRVHFPAPHFTYLTFEIMRPHTLQSINTWIQQNLNNRYYIGKSIMLNKTNTIVHTTIIGFEDAREGSILSMLCPLFQPQSTTTP